MPVYVNPKEDYKLPKTGDLSFKEVVELKKIILQAKKSYMYKYEEEFNDSVEPYNIIDLCYNLASYDIKRTSLDDKTFIQCLEQLLIECNIRLDKSKFGRKKNKFRFDIMGNWTKGEIVILIKKNK